MKYEQIVMGIIVSSGTARSCSMEAISKAKESLFNEANELILKAEEELNNAHDLQTGLIQDEAAGKTSLVTLLMVHAQDHFMNAVTIKDMAKEFIDMYVKISNT